MNNVQIGGGKVLISTFAAILGDASVVRWGEDCGGDSAVKDQLKNVRQIQANRQAFAAIRDDWGCGRRAVQDQLKNVQQIQAKTSLSPPSWVMGLLLHGDWQNLVATAMPCTTN